MTSRRLLIVNRGEVALRIMRSAAEMGYQTVALYSDDDADSLHVARADSALRIAGRGAAAY
ncbi:MAG TPA: biotin carboxylase N-terminal domain-containing protein, partial [Nannocystaceae bacterium]|nr:biotin carboxylase N-terminal domain-containing protein [Nannocystaceae bacterium]